MKRAALGTNLIADLVDDHERNVMDAIHEIVHTEVVVVIAKWVPGITSHATTRKAS